MSAERPESYVITDLSQIKALADPLRQQILGAFVTEPRTTKQVATKLGQPPTKLYRHVDMLERVGLIRLVETRPKRGTTEKYFQAIAHHFSVAQDSLAGGESMSVIESTFAEAFASAQEGLRKAVQCGALAEGAETPGAVVAIGSLSLAPEDLPKLSERISNLAKELGVGRPESETSRYSLLVALYPMVIPE